MTIPIHSPTSSTITPKAQPTDPPLLRIDTQIFTSFPAYRAARAAGPQPRPDNKDDGSDSTASEEEIVCALDEVALSQLPVRLQLNMRKIQAERLRRVHCQVRPLSLRKHQRQSQDLNLDRADAEALPQPEPKPRPKLRLKVFTESELRARDEYRRQCGYDSYEASAQAVAMKEYEANDIVEMPHAVDIKHPRNTASCLVQHEWVPVYHIYGKQEKDNLEKVGMNVDTGKTAAGGRRTVRLCGLDSANKGHLSSAETFIEPGSPILRSARQDGRGVSRGGYMSWRCAGPYYVHGLHAGQDSGKEFEQRQSMSSSVSKLCDRMRTSMSRVKKIFEK